MSMTKDAALLEEWNYLAALAPEETYIEGFIIGLDRGTTNPAGTLSMAVHMMSNALASEDVQEVDRGYTDGVLTALGQ